MKIECTLPWFSTAATKMIRIREVGVWKRRKEALELTRGTD